MESTAYCVLRIAYSRPCPEPILRRIAYCVLRIAPAAAEAADEAEDAELEESDDEGD